jgi:hypothetical protein
MSLFVLTVNDLTQSTKAAETQLIHDACLRAAVQCRSQKTATAGTVIGERGVAIASWVYTGSASTPG